MSIELEKWRASLHLAIMKNCFQKQDKYITDAVNTIIEELSIAHSTNYKKIYYKSNFLQNTKANASATFIDKLPPIIADKLDTIYIQKEQIDSDKNNVRAALRKLFNTHSDYELVLACLPNALLKIIIHAPMGGTCPNTLNADDEKLKEELHTIITSILVKELLLT